MGSAVKVRPERLFGICFGVVTLLWLLFWFGETDNDKAVIAQSVSRMEQTVRNYLRA